MAHDALSPIIALVQHLTKTELNALLQAAKSASDRDWLLILVTFWHGLRASETIKLTAANIRDGFITVQRLKGSLKTTQPLVHHADPLLDEKTAIESRAAAAGPGERLFPVSRVHFFRLMRRYAAVAGIPIHKAHPHALKHTIAMQTIRSAGIENVRAYLGHKSISSTGEYLKVDDDAASAAVTSALHQ